MIMRNSLILIDQIEQDIQAGHESWMRSSMATVRRCRPIVLTALAAVLAMIPLSRSIFFGPDGRCDHGRTDCGDAINPVLFTCLVRAVV